MTLTDELIHLANEFSGEEEYSRAGGGNASITIDDIVYIKPSGVPLATLQAHDLIPLQRSTLLDTLEHPPTGPGDPVHIAARAAQLRDVQGRRPSVEILFHALLPEPLVIHLHPLTVNALTCNEYGEELTHELFGDQALWVKYDNPGLPLAQGIAKARAAYTQRTGLTPPPLTLLGNHGVIVAGNSYEEVAQRTRDLTERVRSAICRAAEAQPSPLSHNEATAIASDLASLTGAQVVTFRTSGLAVEHTMLNVGPISTGPLIPDQVVYSGSMPLVLRRSTSSDDIQAALAAYRERNGRSPIIVVIPQRAVFATGATTKAAQTALDTFIDALQVERDANILGRVRILTDEERLFIETWEAESYRHAIAEKA